MKKRWILLLMIIGFLPSSALAEAPIETLAKQAIVVDYETGAVLMEKNADERMPTSSMSKTLTTHVIFKALKKGQIKLDEDFVVSEKAWRMQGSKMFVELGNRIKVEDLLRGVIIQSGNDATIVLAEGLAGTEEAFAGLLNQEAKEIGMTNSHFMNASGWPDPEHYSTARDLAKLSIATVKDFPEYYKYYAEKEFSYHGIKQGNRNPLLYRNIGADGIKTGHTEAAGYGLMGTAVSPEGRRVIIVVNGLSSEQERADESAKLLEWGMKRFDNRKFFAAGENVENIPVVFGQATHVPITVQKDVLITVPKAGQDSIKITANFKQPVKAPVVQGTELGKLTIEIPDMPKYEVPLYAAANVEKLGFFASLAKKAQILAFGHGA